MTNLRCTKATLRLFGEDLVPEEVSRLLGVAPTHSEAKGKKVDYPPESNRVAKRGSWRLKASPRTPGDLDAQVEELFLKVSDDLVVWHQLTAAFKVDLFCGLFMAGTNDGEVLSPRSMRYLADRGVTLSLDIYDSSDGKK